VGRNRYGVAVGFWADRRPPGEQRLGFFNRPDWRRICRCFPAASSFPSLSTSGPSPSVSHNPGAEEPTGELFRMDVPIVSPEKQRLRRSGIRRESLAVQMDGNRTYFNPGSDWPSR
jgi:hypothetical protein